MVDFDRDYYADLQLDGPTDDERLIRAQYRKLSLRLLVDRSAAEGVDELRVIKEAHEILTDPVQKAEYDSHRLQKNAPSPAKQPHLVAKKMNVRDAWKVGPDNPYETVLANVRRHYEELARDNEANNLKWDVRMKNSQFLPRQPPIPDSNTDKAFMGPLITTIVRDGTVGAPKQSRSVNLDDVDSISSNEPGWRHPTCPDRPTDPQTDRDNRQCKRLQDTPGNQIPWPAHDMTRFFGKALEMLKASGIDFQPGDFHGKAPDGRSDDNISKAAFPKPPRESCQDLRSATSHGHTITHRRPATAPAGWGDYDFFVPWQAQGRYIRKGMVEAFNWHDPAAPEFVCLEIPSQVVYSLEAFVDKDDGDKKKPMSLWRKMAQPYAASAKAKWELDMLEQSLPLPRSQGW